MRVKDAFTYISLGMFAKSELELLQSASKKRVLFCGERIIDVYHYVAPLGRPTKDAILSVEMLDSETFEGGVLAAAKHANQFCGSVTCIESGKVIEKHRYVERSHMHKLFQVYVTRAPLEPKAHDFGAYDSTIVLDYGHGMADARFLNAIQDSNYLAINVQTNSGNFGFNLATKYARADYLCVDEPEARLATQNKCGPIEDSLFKLQDIAPKVAITLGKAGAIGASLDEDLVRVPAFTDKIVDTMGAGDAFFAVTALVAKDADMKSLLRIGNAAGAIKANIIGHSSSVTKDALISYLNQVR